MHSIINQLKDKISAIPNRYFILTSLFFGVIFAILVPPFQIPDELIHFTRAYEVSELKTSEEYKIRGVTHLGSELPTSILKTYKATRLEQIPGYPDVAQAKKYAKSDTRYSLGIPLNESDRTFFDTGSSPAYFPLLYAPQAITVAILQQFNAPIILMLYATRITGLLVWILLVAAAFKYVRSSTLKLALSAVLLLPMFVSQASASTDPLINGLLVLYIAMMSYFISKKVTPNNVQITLLITALSTMTLSKPVYAIFGLLLFLLPSIYGRAKAYAKITLLVMIPLIVYVLWSTLNKVDGPYYVDAIAISNADPSEQVKYVIPNIFNFFQPFINTLLLGWGDGVATSLIGMFGKLDTPLPLIFVLLGFLIIFVAILASADNREKRKPVITTESRKYIYTKRAIYALLMVGYTAGVYLAMYIVSTPPHEKIITGIQGRYLLPLIPFGVLFASKGSIVFRKKIIFERFLYIAPVILLIASTIVIFIRFYAKYP